MPRVNSAVLRAPFYLYRSDFDAEAGSLDGGTGFILLVEAPDIEETLGNAFVYGVTCAHVVNQGHRTVRLNQKNGGFKIWTPDETGQPWHVAEEFDLAVALLNARWQDVSLFPLSLRGAVSREDCAGGRVGVGDPVYMVGRLLHAEGVAMNTPVVRFGNIAMMPGEPVLNEYTGREHECFLVEARSIPGFSGSPVFAFEGDSPTGTLSLIGVDWGHLTTRHEWAERNAGIACVTPAWRIVELVMRKDVAEERRIQWERIAESQLNEAATEIERLLPDKEAM